MKHNPEAAAAERRYARHLDAYPHYKAYTLAMAEWFDGERVDRPEWTDACQCHLDHKRADDNARDRAHRANRVPDHLDY